MNRVILCWVVVLFFAQLALAQVPAPDFDVTLYINATASSNISVVNQCSQRHNFELQKQNAPFFNISQNQVQVNGGQTVNVPVQFNTQNMSPGMYQGQVTVACLTCKNEPTCNQDRTVLRIVLHVTPPPNQPNNPPNNQPPQNPANPPANPPAGNPPGATTGGDSWDSIPKGKIPLVNAVFDGFLKGPCAIMEIDCEKLRLAAAQAEAAAADAQAKADGAKTTASDAEKKAKDAEDAAKKAAGLVQPEGPTNAVVDGEGYTEADSDYLETLRNRNNADLAAGKITVEQHQQRANALNTKVAREERLAEQARLKKEAEEAKKKADAARAAANAANAAAAAAQAEADAAKQAAADALEAYKKCLKQLEDECLRQQAAAKAKKDADDAAAAAAAKKKKDDEDRARQDQINAAARAAEVKYLLDNIRKLGLITYKPKTNVPDPLDWFFDLMEKLGTSKDERDFWQSVAGQIGGGPIDPAYINVLAELYKALGSFFDIRTAAGKQRAFDQLTTKIINPKTGKSYTDQEALDKIAKMEKLMKELQDKVKAAQAAAQGSR